jgi:hypothetical protein
MTGGQRGWTETYGWLHEGKWQDDFEALVSDRRAEIEASNAVRSQEASRAKAQDQNRVSDILSAY